VAARKTFPFFPGKSLTYAAWTHGSVSAAEKEAAFAEPVKQGPVMTYQKPNAPVSFKICGNEIPSFPVKVISRLIKGQKRRVFPEGDAGLHPFSLSVTQGVPPVHKGGIDVKPVHETFRAPVARIEKFFPAFGRIIGTLGTVYSSLSLNVSRRRVFNSGSHEEECRFTRAVIACDACPAFGKLDAYVFQHRFN
jgi:hypothetical protein